MSIYKTADEYVRRNVIDNFSLYSGDNKCEIHEDTVATRRWMILEPGFTEYSYCCETCVEMQVAAAKFYYEFELSGETMHCDDCDTTQPLFTKLINGGYQDNLHRYSPSFDSATVDVCSACYKRVQSAFSADVVYEQCFLTKVHRVDYHFMTEATKPPISQMTAS